LGEALVAEGIISQGQLDRMLAEQRAAGGLLGEMLVQQGVIDGAQLLRHLARQLGVPFCQLRHGLVDFALLPLLGDEEAQRLCAIPMFRVHDTLTVAMAEPQSLPKIDRLSQLTGCRIRAVLAPRDNILEFLRSTPRATRTSIPSWPRCPRARSRSSRRNPSTTGPPPTWTRWSRAARSSTWSTSPC
jgi:type IV pilus assembly protein PilB